MKPCSLLGLRRFCCCAQLLGTMALVFCWSSLRLPAAENGVAAKLGNPFFAMDTAIHGGTPDDQAEMLKELGYAGLSCGIDADIPAVLGALDQHGLRLFAVYAGAELGESGPGYDARLPKVIEQLQGRETIVWLTVAGKTADAEEQAVKIVREVAELAHAGGLRVALYPHAGNFLASMADAVRIAQQVDRENVGVSFNLCHWLKEGQPENMSEDIRRAAARLFVVTINGADRQGKDWRQLIQTLDQGDFDVYSFLMALRSAGFRGPVGFQGYGIEGNTRDNLRRTMDRWQQFVARSAE